MKKYIGAVVRKSSQLPIAAEQERFENKSPVAKKTDLFLPTGTLKKTKLYYRSHHTMNRFGRPAAFSIRTRRELTGIREVGIPVHILATLPK